MDDDILLPPSVLPTRFWDIDVHPEYANRAERTALRTEHTAAMSLLVWHLHIRAGDIDPLDETGVRVLDLDRNILLADGSELAPTAVSYVLSPDNTKALIVNVQPLPDSETVTISPTTFTAALVGLIMAVLNRK